MRTQHPWRKAAEGIGRRFTAGLITSLSLTLVAFEWRSTAEDPPAPLGELIWEEDGIAYPRVFTIEEQKRKEQPKPRPASGGPVQAGDERPEEAEEGVHEEGSGGLGETSEPASESDGTGNPEETIDDSPMPWGGVEQQPYFRSCLGLTREEINPCTERIIDRHLKERFRVPETVRREERTTISIVIDDEGRIARVLCVPAPSPAVEAEIRRVIDELPPMMPGTQNGRPVPVVFQLPFKVRRV